MAVVEYQHAESIVHVIVQIMVHAYVMGLTVQLIAVVMVKHFGRFVVVMIVKMIVLILAAVFV